MPQMERCPACRAKLAGAETCPRCGSDFTTACRAERQATVLARLAVRELSSGHIGRAADAADAAVQLASSPLARAVSRTLLRRKKIYEDTASGPLEDTDTQA